MSFSIDIGSITYLPIYLVYHFSMFHFSSSCKPIFSLAQLFLGLHGMALKVEGNCLLYYIMLHKQTFGLCESHWIAHYLRNLELLMKYSIWL